MQVDALVSRSAPVGVPRSRSVVQPPVGPALHISPLPNPRAKPITRLASSASRLKGIRVQIFTETSEETAASAKLITCCARSAL